MTILTQGRQSIVEVNELQAVVDMQICRRTSTYDFDPVCKSTGGVDEGDTLIYKLRVNIIGKNKDEEYTLGTYGADIIKETWDNILNQISAKENIIQLPTEEGELDFIYSNTERQIAIADRADGFLDKLKILLH